MTSGEKYDYLFKFIIIGDTGTGKSCILHRFVENKCTRPRLTLFMLLAVPCLVCEQDFSTSTDEAG